MSTQVPTTSDATLSYSGALSRTFDSAPNAARPIFSRSGVRAQLTQAYRPDGGIEQRFHALDGTQWNFLTPQGDTLLFDVLMRSRRLTQDVRFRIRYHRG